MDSERRLTYVIVATLLFAVLLSYLPLRHNDFVTYDDFDYIVKNTQIHSGLNVDNVRWALTTSYFSYWHPLTWISHMADIEMFGLNPRGHHMVNLLFHMANTALLFLGLRMMTGRIWESAFVAALFALHPMSVDSVAWAAERKNVLSTFFWFGVFISYIYYVRRPVLSRYLFVLAAFILGLMSKPMLVTVPFLLLLLDYWPLKRLEKGKTLSLIAEKIPLFMLSGVSLLIAIVPQVKLGTVIPLDMLPMSARIVRAVNSSTGYLIHMISPDSLTVLYPYIRVWPWWQSALSVLFLVTVSVVSFIGRKRYPYLLIGWLWYLGTLVPVLQVFQVNVSPIADRYAYVPIVGVFIMIAWGMRDILPKRRYIALIVCAAAVLGVYTSRQTAYWKDSGALYKHAIDVTELNYMAYNNYGVYLMENGRVDEALIQFGKGLEIVPHNEELSFNMGAALVAKGRLQEAQRYLLGSARMWYTGDRAAFYKTLAATGFADGKYAEALDAVEKALVLSPKDADLVQLKAEILKKIGETAPARIRP